MSIPVTGARWKSRQLAGRRQYTLIIQGDADELAYLTQQMAQAATERAQGRLRTSPRMHPTVPSCSRYTGPGRL